MFRDPADLAYTLGHLQTEYQALRDEGDLDADFTIYDSFRDIHIEQKPYLRRLARLRGRLDALDYLANDAHPPTAYDWLDPDPDALRANIEATLTDVCTRRGDSGSTWTEYLRGWLQSTHYALGNPPTAHRWSDAD